MNPFKILRCVCLGPDTRDVSLDMREFGEQSGHQTNHCIAPRRDVSRFVLSLLSFIIGFQHIPSINYDGPARFVDACLKNVPRQSPSGI